MCNGYTRPEKGNVKARLSFRAKGRNLIEAGEGYQLREHLSSCKALLVGENEGIDLKDTYFWGRKLIIIRISR